MSLRLLSCALALALASSLTAQTCTFQLNLFDSFGDGWNGAELTLRLNGVPTTYTITAEQRVEARFTLEVTEGDEIEIDYEDGAFPGENTFFLLDNDETVLYASPPNGPEGENVFSTTARCATCLAPLSSSIVFRRVRSTTVDVQFTRRPETPNPTYRILYREGGDFDPTTATDITEILTTDTLVRVDGLTPDALHTFYLTSLCNMNSDTSGLRGPFEVTTQKRRDVGVTALMNPVSGCGLSGENVTIGITNFGGEPQAFFNVDFSVNGAPGGVSRPEDGIFTGVLGVDSTEFFTFDARAFLNEPGDYEFKLWTELEDDEVPDNDTLTFTVRSVGTIFDFPYTENFEESDGSWYVSQEGAGEASWEWGVPDGDVITQTPQGERAWVTNLTGSYNNRENSALTSPCLDFSTLTEDPYLTAFLAVNTETNFDELVIETSVDGEEWDLLETGPATINWYNNLEEQIYEGTGGFPGFAVIGAPLENTAGADRAQVRFRLTTDGSVTREGILVDAVTIGPRAENNLAAVQATAIGEDLCGTVMDSVAFRITNVGLENATDFPVSYRVNDGDVVTETFTGTLNAGATATYRFATTYDGSLHTFSEITAWTALDGDAQLTNDTTVVVRRSSFPVPFVENFEEATVPGGWDVPFPTSVGTRDEEIGNALFQDITEVRDSLVFTTANYGPVETGDSLIFKYFQRTGGGAEAPSEEPAQLTLNLIQNCGDTIFLEEFNLTGDTCIRLAMDDYAGSSVRILFDLRYAGDDDFFAYFDNIGIFRCEPLNLSAEVTDATRDENGSATVITDGGFGPYDYAWTVPNDGASADDLTVGSYSVTVTDAAGCSEFVVFNVNLNTRVDEPTAELANLSVFPNPTADRISVRLETIRATNLRLDLFDLAGRRLLSRPLGRSNLLREELDLTSYPAGTYLLRVQSGEGARTLRIVKR